jgi:hypothetical protein
MANSQEQRFSAAEYFDHPTPAIHSPRRITITVPYQLYERLVERSKREGRSLSNLAAFLLEHYCRGSLDRQHKHPPLGITSDSVL